MSLTDGIIGCWSPSLGASGYRLLDRSRYSNHGVLTNMDAGTDWVGTSAGLALDYDGTNDYVTLGTKDLYNPSTALSVAAWIRPTAVVSYYNVWGMSNTGATTYRAMWVYNSRLTFAWGALSGNYRDYTTTAATITANAWQHVAAGHTGTGAPVLWVNGVQVATTFTSGGVATLPTTQQSDIGRLGNNFYFSGQIGEVALFQRQVTSGEILDLYRRGNGAIGRELTGQARRRTYGFVAAGFRPYWAARRTQIIGGGVR
jgi:hypothetical protein